MKRREFVKHSALTAGLLTVGGVGLSSFSASNAKKITILHTNDVHSHIDPFGPNDGRNSNKGGVARRATIIENIRKENPNTLLLDAGDIFQGTPYFNFYGGELEFKLMSMLKYDVVTIGNHDFDNGIEGLHAQLPYAKFNFVSANYDFTNTVMDTFVKPYKIIIKDSIKIGIFGLGIELEGLVMKDLYKETNYLNPIEIAQDMSAVLKNEEKCDLVICLSHLGYDYKNEPNKVSDLSLAAATENIDLIIGGHTHTFLKEPTVVKNRKDKNVLVNQVGCYGLYLGRIDFYFDSQKNKTSDGTAMVV
ncbi:metallophosphatase [Aquimarina sp. MMG015]|uniref:bifunctional metallophosphatase/5'-nucleotidase n=1 Tax=unclassified Aquimarina TaxID=2627091 RepID=UPI000E553FFD|nr:MULTISPECIES: metallophosphatase [unclassified Aquimarina]AXT54528.1 bifunctional metallophosphatase/5'-nucleotidase [Aquimarina sp. AD1]MBQ4804620.1 metallophosphatase [Aquimarina sp. MMG015]RKN07092.1 bifunctional metallophosphatase/5'-nucleotidase [Aquimarina sp. AD1]